MSRIGYPPDYHDIEFELRRRREQVDSVRDKDTPFRVEFRYGGGTKHWQYFVSSEDAASAEDSLCSYGPTGRAIIRRPSSQIIQVQGPRGGWKRFIADALERKEK